MDSGSRYIKAYMRAPHERAVLGNGNYAANRMQHSASGKIYECALHGGDERFQVQHALNVGFVEEGNSGLRMGKLIHDSGPVFKIHSSDHSKQVDGMRREDSATESVRRLQ